ncbi:MAG TPA: hypothetical protein VFJ16_22480 [Longimicrobium sp.]|nr:hypothetical protein [Longimicrobium sp.]
MKKLKLDLDALAVDSYATVAAEAPHGTVAAHSDTVVVTVTVTLTIEATVALSWIC